MACFRPLSAFQREDGSITFVERGRIRRLLTLPCGQCIGCRLERSRKWAVRCMHEASLWDGSSFVTLTYSDENCPTGLHYPDFQKFMKRVRRRFGPIRFFMCGEYGETNYRPHFHACLFGLFFADRVLHSSGGNIPLYRSPILEKLWPHGFATVGDVTFESAGYCARYVMKKITGPAAEQAYNRVCLSTGEIIRVPPEFCRMSLKPGIGAPWIRRYHSDVYSFTRDEVVVNGVKTKPPRYYDKELESLNPEVHEHLELLRYQKSGLCADDSTPERLAVREKVAQAKFETMKRNL